MHCPQLVGFSRGTERTPQSWRQLLAHEFLEVRLQAAVSRAGQRAWYIDQDADFPFTDLICKHRRRVGDKDVAKLGKG